jgi:hypothetical protein
MLLPSHYPWYYHTNRWRVQIVKLLSTVPYSSLLGANIPLNTLLPNLTVEWIALLLLIWEVLGSNLGYTDWGSMWVSQSLQAMPDQYFRLDSPGWALASLKRIHLFKAPLRVSQQWLFYRVGSSTPLGHYHFLPNPFQFTIHCYNFKDIRSLHRHMYCEYVQYFQLVLMKPLMMAKTGRNI